MPAGPKGRFAPFIPNYWAIWSFGKNKSAAKSLLTHLSQPSANLVAVKPRHHDVE